MHKHCSIHFLGQRMKVVQEVNFPPVNGQFPVAYRLICRSECLLSKESLQIAVSCFIPNHEDSRPESSIPPTHVHYSFYIYTIVVYKVTLVHYMLCTGTCLLAILHWQQTRDIFQYTVYNINLYSSGYVT